MERVSISRTLARPPLGETRVCLWAISSDHSQDQIRVVKFCFLRKPRQIVRSPISLFRTLIHSPLFHLAVFFLQTRNTRLAADGSLSLFLSSVTYLEYIARYRSGLHATSMHENYSFFLLPRYASYNLTWIDGSYDYILIISPRLFQLQ